MGHETIKRIILEQYGIGNYLVLGNKNTIDCCGVTLQEALDNIKEQMEEEELKVAKGVN